MYIRVTGRSVSPLPVMDSSDPSHPQPRVINSVVSNWRPEPRRPVSLGSSSVTVLQTLALEAPGSGQRPARQFLRSEFPVKVGRESIIYQDFQENLGAHSNLDCTTINPNPTFVLIADASRQVQS